MTQEKTSTDGVNGLNKGRATLVLSIGGAGAKKLLTHKKMAEDMGTVEDYRYIHVDTAEENEMHEDEDIDVVSVEADNRSMKMFDRCKNGEFDVHYLSDEHTYKTEGTSRERAVSRYKFESELDRLHEKIKTEIQDLRTENSEIVVFTLCSLSGGTGSGSLPLVSVLLREIIENIDGVDIRLVGAATAPKLKKGPGKMSEETKKYTNAHTALREIETLLKNEESKIPVPAANPDTLTDERRVSGSPFDCLFITPIREEKVDDAVGDERVSYTENINYQIGHLINWLQSTSKKGLENIFTDLLREDGTVYTLDVREVRAPVSDFSELVDKKRELDTKEDSITDIRGEISVLEDEKEELSTFLESTSESTPNREGFSVDTDTEVTEPFEDLELNDKFGQRIDEMRANLHTWGDWETIQNYREREFRFLGDPNRSVDMQEIVDYLFYGRIKEVVSKKIENHKLEKVLAEAWRNRVTSGDAVDITEDNIEDIYRETIAYLRQNDSGLKTKILSKLGKANTNKELGRKIRKLRRHYRGLKDTQNRLKKNEESVYSSLRDTQKELSEDIEDKSREVKGLENETDSLREEMESLIAKLDSKERRGIHQVYDGDILSNTTQNGIQELADKVEKSLTSAENLSDIIRRGLVRQDGVDEAVDEVLNRGFRERFEDSISVDGHKSVRECLAVSTHEDNTELAEKVIEPEGKVDRYFRSVGHNDPFRITLICMFEGVSLKNTGVYSTVLESYERGRLEELFGPSEDAGKLVERSNAYPELQNCSQDKDCEDERSQMKTSVVGAQVSDINSEFTNSDSGGE
jgi:predicted  nucleic acid-binding Zn-ribbon protein